MTSDEIGIFLSQESFSGYLLKPKILESLKFHNFIIFCKKKNKDEKCHHTGFKIKNFPLKKKIKKLFCNIYVETESSLLKIQFLYFKIYIF